MKSCVGNMGILIPSWLRQLIMIIHSNIEITEAPIIQVHMSKFDHIPCSDLHRINKIDQGPPSVLNEGARLQPFKLHD